MTTAEKLVKIAENEQKVYEAGQKSMVDESKIIEKTVSGSVIALDDASEIPHEVCVQLSSDTVKDFSGVAVKVFGENFWKFGSSFSVEGNGTTQALVDTYDFDLPLGVYTFSCDTEIENLNMSSNGNGVYLGVTREDGTVAYHTIVGNDSVSGKVTFTVDISSSAINRFTMGLHNRVTSGTIKITNIYLTASEHESYVPKADGSVNVKSMSPYMTISTDTNGVNISATYHKSWGMQTEYDRFWDDFQKGGSRNAYPYAFTNWDGEYIKPKYKIAPTSGGMSQMFYSNTKLKKIEAKYFDFSNLPAATYASADLYYTFQFCSNLEEIEDVGISVNFFTGTFHGCGKLHTIAKLRVNENTQFSTNPFHSCFALEEIRFEGTIGKSLDIHWSTKLSMPSLASIVNALSKTASGQSITLPTTARQTYDDATVAGRWDELVAEYPNWSFKYS